MGPSPRGLAGMLAAHKTGVEATSYGRVGGAFDNGATIGKQRQFVGIAPEFEDEVIVADRAVGLQPPIHLGVVDGTLALMNLYGISAAKRDVRPPFAGEVDKIAFTAGAAARARFGC
jgi:hypothetical protein